MKSSIKTIAAACLMLLTLTQAVSCGNGNGGGSGTGGSGVSSGVTSGSVTGETQEDYLKKLGDKNFGGKTFSLLGPYNFARQTFSTDAETGEPVNDALYNRDQFISEKYNVKLNCVLTEDFANTVSKAVLSGDTTYSLVLNSMMTLNPLCTSGYLYDLKKLPYVQLDEKWWCKSAEENLLLNGGLYFTTGPLTPQFYFAAYVMAYNENLAADYKIGDLKKLVKDGKWTLDKMFEYTAGVSSDLDGDSVMTEKDFYGFAFDNVAYPAYYISAGQKLSDYGSDGKPVVKMNSADSIAAIEKLASFFKDDQNIAHGEKWAKNTEHTIFIEGRALFLGNSISNIITKCRDMADDFSIIPCPKYDEKQESYSTYANPWCLGGISVPVNCADTDMTGFLAEAMAYKSYELVRVAQYDVTLKQKVSRNSDTELMLDLIYDNIHYDLNGIFDFGGSSTVLTNAVTGGAQFASAYAAVEPKVQADIAKLLNTLGGK